MSWREQAACRGTRTDRFFPSSNDPSKEVVALCESCPVRHECLDDAIRNGEEYGIRGGVSMNSYRPERVKTCPECGDEHRRRRAKFCSEGCAYQAAVRRQIEDHNGRRDRVNWAEACRWCGDPTNGAHMKDGFCSWTCRSSWSRDRTRRLLA